MSLVGITQNSAWAFPQKTSMRGTMDAEVSKRTDVSELLNVARYSWSGDLDPVYVSRKGQITR